MNAAAPTPVARTSPPPVKRPPVGRGDTDFLPAAIEILEAPPSPVRIGFLLAICALTATALAWSYFGHVDIIATARGKIQPTGRVKVIQPAEGGKVARIAVANGQTVKEGDLLLELVDADARADEAAAMAGLHSYRAEAARRAAALATARSPDFRLSAVAWPSDTPAAVREREERVLGGDVAQLAASVASLDAQARQKEAERRRLTETAAAQQNLIDVLKQRVDIRATLASSGAGAVTSLIDAKENLAFHSATLATTRGQLEESAASAEVLKRDRAKLIDTFVAENRQKLADAERQADDFGQKLAKARARLDHLTFRSPIAGTIAATTVTAPGQVVGVAEEVIRIVPSGAALEIEAYLENKDIGFVEAGQEAQVKIESFPFTRYGAIEAVVTRVATDAIPEQDASQIEGDPARATKSSGFAGAQRTQNLVFPATLTPRRTEMDVGDKRVPLSPGMAVTVEIRTGSRRILEYVFSPLVETASKAMKER